MPQSDTCVKKFLVSKDGILSCLNHRTDSHPPRNRALDKYNYEISNPVLSGCGCHSWLMRISNLGVIAGVDPDQIFRDIRRAIGPGGNRHVPDHEILVTIKKALRDRQGGTWTPAPRPKPIVPDGNAALRKIIGQGKISDDADLWEASPIRLSSDLKNDMVIFIGTLFNPDELVWIGDREQPGIIGKTIRSASEWITHFQSGGYTAPHIIVNPFSGLPAPKKSGDGETYRGDGNIASYRHCLVEFDDISREEQIRFWSAVKLPIRALIDSGGKSIHAWLDVQKLSSVNTSDEWQSEIKERLYTRILTPLGVDSTCSNPSRLSRLPGHFREEKKSFQRLLWLSPEGRSIC